MNNFIIPVILIAVLLLVIMFGVLNSNPRKFEIFTMIFPENNEELLGIASSGRFELQGESLVLYEGRPENPDLVLDETVQGVVKPVGFDRNLPCNPLKISVRGLKIYEINRIKNLVVVRENLSSETLIPTWKGVEENVKNFVTKMCLCFNNQFPCTFTQ
jgi:hypothetical protein